MWGGTGGVFLCGVFAGRRASVEYLCVLWRLARCLCDEEGLLGYLSGSTSRVLLFPGVSLIRYFCMRERVVQYYAIVNVSFIHF